MRILASTKLLTAAAVAVAAFVWAAPEAQAYLNDESFTVTGRDMGTFFEECWEFRTLDQEIYIDGGLAGTWDEFYLLTWLITGPFSFTYFDVEGTDYTARGLAWIGIIFGRWESATSGSLFFGFADECAAD